MPLQEGEGEADAAEMDLALRLPERRGWSSGERQQASEPQDLNLSFLSAAAPRGHTRRRGLLVPTSVASNPFPVKITITSRSNK